MAEKLHQEGDEKSALKLLKVLERGGQGKEGISPARAITPTTLPVDRDSRFALADEIYPAVGNIRIQLDKLVEGSIEEFVSLALSISESISKRDIGRSHDFGSGNKAR